VWDPVTGNHRIVAVPRICNTGRAMPCSTGQFFALPSMKATSTTAAFQSLPGHPGWVARILQKVKYRRICVSESRILSDTIGYLSPDFFIFQNNKDMHEWIMSCPNVKFHMFSSFILKLWWVKKYFYHLISIVNFPSLFKYCLYII
jgi:hypothetical protein